MAAAGISGRPTIGDTSNPALEGNPKTSALPEFGLEECLQSRQSFRSIGTLGRYQNFAALGADQSQKIQQVFTVYGVAASGNAHIGVVLGCNLHDLRGHPRMDSQLVRYDEFLLQYNRLSTRLMCRRRRVSRLKSRRLLAQGLPEVNRRGRGTQGSL